MEDQAPMHGVPAKRTPLLEIVLRIASNQSPELDAMRLVIEAAEDGARVADERGYVALAESYWRTASIARAILSALSKPAPQRGVPMVTVGEARAAGMWP